MKYQFEYQFPIGKISIFEENGRITEVLFSKKFNEPNSVLQETDLLKEAARQLNEYLSGQRKKFSLPLSPSGTPFFQSVWEALQEIPFGQTVTYQEIAIKIKNPKGVRAVGNANNRNPIPIFIPCHRVIGKNGKLVGYAGGLEMKRQLLDIEGILIGD